ncbi:UNVERIFIED_CONTAM: hypothetical protein Slati_0889600 [Sesamum latifolium]|uniref:Uncharacterized protein n=1 Tax=Sesamum latifolium TaxID=2727402 RepID=A0AAW2XQS8_9LAMI
MRLPGPVLSLKVQSVIRDGIPLNAKVQSVIRDGIPLNAKVQSVIRDGNWDWKEILDIEHREITHQLPVLTEVDTISWNSTTGQFTIAEAFRLWQPPGPKVLCPIPYSEIHMDGNCSMGEPEMEEPPSVQRGPEGIVYFTSISHMDGT